MTCTVGLLIACASLIYSVWGWARVNKKLRGNV